ncbi:complex I assembly factor TIMMDC1, mitochondrial [Stigmatopora nigra]
MHAEPSTTGSAPRRRLADSAPGGAWSTVPARGLIGIGAAPRFCLPLPRVHAAEVDSAHSAQMPSPLSSTCATPPHPVAASVMPSNIGKPEFPDTGWDRIKDLFQKDVNQSYPEEVTNVIKSGFFAALAGLIYGGLPAAHHVKQRYIQQNQAELYTSRVEAVRLSHNAAIRGFVKYGVRWSWRVAAFVTLFNSVSTGLSVYRDKYTFGNFAAAGAVTGGLFRLNLGLRGLVAGTIIGTVLGIPTGAVIMSMNSLAGENVRDRRRRERRELYELKVAEWTARLELTDELVGDLNAASQPEATEGDLKRIHELLNLPQNEDSSSQ